MVPGDAYMAAPPDTTPGGDRPIVVGLGGGWGLGSTKRSAAAQDVVAL